MIPPPGAVVRGTVQSTTSDVVGLPTSEPRWAAARRFGSIELVRDRQWTIGVGSALALWAGAVFALVYSEHTSFRTARFDLGNMVQAVWSTAHGRPLEATTAAGEQMVRLGGHVDPILALLTPLWMLVPSPMTLAAVQIAAVSVGALPLYWLARRHLHSNATAAVIAVAYLASPWIAWTASDAMHPKTFAIPLFLFAVWFLEAHRLWPFAACAVLACASGELMGMTVAALGLWYAVAHRRRRAGLTIAVAGAAWTVVALYVIVPAFSGGSSVYYGFYSEVGGSPTGILRTTVSDPGAIASALTGRNELLYVLLLAAPLAGLFVLSPLMALVAAPQLFVNMLADAPGPTDPRHHYIAAVVPFLFAATAIGLGRLSRDRRRLSAGLVLALSLMLSMVLGPWPGTGQQVPIRYEVGASPGHEEVLRRAVALVPDDVAVSSTNKAGSHLAARQYLYSVPVVKRAEWVLVDSHDVWVAHQGLPYLAARPRRELLAFTRVLERDPAWSRVFAEDGVYVFRKVNR